MVGLGLGISQYIFYDKEYQVVSHEIEMVTVTAGASGAWETLSLPDFKADQDGYLQVFVAYESGKPIWFDDLKITHQPALVVQENHYYQADHPDLLTHSPYLGMANNPVRYFDPLGNRFDEGSQEIRENFLTETTNLLIKNANTILALQSQLEGASEQKRTKINKQIRNLEAKNSELNAALNEYNVLDESAVLYTITSDSRTGSGAFTYNNGSFNISFDGENNYVLAQELKHAYQFETGEISFNPNGRVGLVYDIFDEVDGYRRDYAYNSPDTPNDYDEIDVDWVRSISRIYRNLPQVRLNRNSTYNQVLASRNGSPILTGLSPKLQQGIIEKYGDRPIIDFLNDLTNTKNGEIFEIIR